MRYGDTAVSTLDTRCQSLLAYLILNRSAHTRQQIAFLFWPDSTEAQARTNLRKAIYKLRQNLPQPDQFLRIDRQTIQWQPDASFTLDVNEFEKSLKVDNWGLNEANHQSSIINLQQTIALYPGDLLPDHYDDWVLATREQLRQRYLASLDQLILHLEQERQYQSAIRYARRLLREDPLHEAAYRRLMRLQALDGNVASALRVYHTCATNLQRDLGVRPSSATQETYERLLKIEAPGIVPLPARVPLVAREPVWKNLQAIWRQAARQQPHVVLLTGEAGIGKTRMAEELLDWAVRQGITTVTAVCYAAEGQLPYAPIADWLRNDELQTVLSGVADKWIIECARLLPELLAQRPELPPPGPLTQGWQRQHLFTALAQAILAARQPLLLFVDDLQWCDQDTLDWLHFLLRFDKHARFLLLGAVQTEEVTPGHPLVGWQQFIQRDGNLTTLKLNRLDATATNRLANLITQRPLTPEQASYFYTETEGIPLFVVEMARVNPLSPTNSHQQPTANLPPKIQAVIEARLNQLSPSARELTNLAAAIGRSFTFELLTKASGKDESAAVHNLDELWQRRIVRERGLDAYDFSHDKIRQVAYAGLSLARRRLLHGRIITALETLYADNLDNVSGQLAAHYEATQQLSEAVHFYQRAAQVAQALYANKDTVKYLRQAIDLSSKIKVNPQQQFEIYEQIGDALKSIGRFEEAEEDLVRAIALTMDPWNLTRLYQSIAGAQGMQGHLNQADISLNEAEEVLQQSSQNPPERWWREWLEIRLKRLNHYCFTNQYYSTNQIEEMIQLSEEIRPIIEQYGSPEQQVKYHRVPTRFGFRRERYVLSNETVTCAEVAYTAAQATGNIAMLANTRFDLALANLWFGWQGNLNEAEYHLKGTLDSAEEMGNVHLQARCQNYLALLHRRLGNTKQVSELLPKALLAAEECNFQGYIATIEANLAWLRWKEGNLAAAKAHGKKALDIWQPLSIDGGQQWTALWPLIDIALTQNEIEQAVLYAQYLLQPEKSNLPDELISTLRLAISAFDNDSPETSCAHLMKSLHHARQLGQL